MAWPYEPLKFPLCLAPMVGLSHAALRAVLREYLPPEVETIFPTEMLNSRRLPYEKVGATPETCRGSNEKLLIPQILGNEEGAIAQSLRKLEDWGADGIDINMGCPVQKALKHNYGVSLIGDADYAARVVEMTVRNTQLPVSVKLRVAGPEQGADYFFKFVKGLESAGVSWLTLHPRTGSQKRRGQADWSEIKKLKSWVRVPVIGNGDIQTWQDVFQMREETGCDLVMSGRALAARPWMLWQVGERMGLPPPAGKSGRAPQTPEEEGQAYGQSLLSLIQHSREFFSEELALRKVRFHIKTTHVWLDFGHHLYSQATACKSLAELESVILAFFDQVIEMKPRTDLRQ